MSTAKTTIQISVNTRNRLNEMGDRGESFNTIINRLLDELEEKRQGE